MTTSTYMYLASFQPMGLVIVAIPSGWDPQPISGQQPGAIRHPPAQQAGQHPQSARTATSGARPGCTPIWSTNSHLIGTWWSTG